MPSSFAPSIDYLSSAANGDYLDLSNNPYFQGAMSASLKPLTDNFENNVLPAVTAQFGGAGRPGAGLQASAIDQATTNFDRATADAVTQAANQAYSTERGLQSGAAAALPNTLAP